ncbi:hypothetical protein FocTR4_00007040 [Fusarium oxysporum f. sp. cubense]|uniref:Uncharacterized protein n=1 Tax=Fusarium oxysporum f. sp. cubense TaxID=61366 RepID=A0A5C6TLA5_FUSOC|nr:hypothetical protein FocTR4_00007040 [Fusarium oxysporum f. sp. cubense]
MVAMCLGRGRTTKQNWCMFGGRACSRRASCMHRWRAIKGLIAASTSWVVLENRGQGHCSRYCCMPPWRKTARCTGGHVCPTVAMHKQHRGVVPNQPEIARSHRHGQKERHFDNSNSQELSSTVFQPSSATSQWIRYVKSQAAGLDNGPSHIPPFSTSGT